MRTLAVILTLSVLSLGAAPRRAVSVAAGADLQFVLPELLRGLARAHPDIDVEVSFGSSGTFFEQLLRRAPFDVYLSADTAYPRQLAAKGLGLPGGEFQYATGKLVVWVPNGSPLDLPRLGMQALAAPGVRKVAIANPAHAPYGRAAQAALRHLGLAAVVAPRLVLGENIAQAAQFVETGAADIGVLALSLALAPPLRRKGRYVEVPPEAYPRIEQGGLILSWTKEPAAAGQLRDYLRSVAGRETLAAFGFGPPSS